jgi:hypothetical protein
VRRCIMLRPAPITAILRRTILLPITRLHRAADIIRFHHAIERRPVRLAPDTLPSNWRRIRLVD